jgi:hypothetical protein
MTADGNLKAFNYANKYFQMKYPEKYEAIEIGSGPDATTEQKAAAEKAKQELQEARKNTTDA